MKTLGITLLFAAAAVNCPAQQWELGGVGGGSFLNTTSVSSPVGAATAGFQSGFVGGAFFGQWKSRVYGVPSALDGPITTARSTNRYVLSLFLSAR